MELGGTQISSSRLSGSLCWGMPRGPGVGVAPTSTHCFFTQITLSRLRTCPVSSSLGAGITSYQSLDGGRGGDRAGVHPPSPSGRPAGGAAPVILPVSPAGPRAPRHPRLRPWAAGVGSAPFLGVRPRFVLQ